MILIYKLTRTIRECIKLVRQHLDYTHWYDLSKDDCREEYTEMPVYRCMNNTAGSFEVNPRLQRHFVTFAIVSLDLRVSSRFTDLLDGHLQKFSSEIQQLSAIHQCGVGTARRMASSSKTCNFHYEFNLRHLSTSSAC